MASQYLSLYAIPAFWMIALYPHSYAIALIKTHTKQWDNCNPRGTGTATALSKLVPPEIYARFERAEAAHKNAMENAPWFIGAILVGNFAGLGHGTMNTVAGAYLGLRIVHSWLYINVTRQKTSYLRTLTYVVSLVLLIGTYIAAANKMKSK